MAIQRRELLAAGAAATALGGLPRARAQAPTLRIGVITDMSRPIATPRDRAAWR